VGAVLGGDLLAAGDRVAHRFPQAWGRGDIHHRVVATVLPEVAGDGDHLQQLGRAAVAGGTAHAGGAVAGAGRGGGQELGGQGGRAHHGRGDGGDATSHGLHSLARG